MLAACWCCAVPRCHRLCMHRLHPRVVWNALCGPGVACVAVCDALCGTGIVYRVRRLLVAALKPSL